MGFRVRDEELSLLLDPEFSESSFGFRPGRSAHGAVRQVQRYIGEGYRFAVDLDLEKFFDRVNHDVLMARVARKVRDKGLFGLVATCGRVCWSGNSSRQIDDLLILVKSHRTGERVKASVTRYLTRELKLAVNDLLVCKQA